MSCSKYYKLIVIYYRFSLDKNKETCIIIIVNETKIKNKGDKKMNTNKIFGIVLEDDVYKSYELFSLEGTGVKACYIIQCTTAQINNIVRMLNNINKEVK